MLETALIGKILYSVRLQADETDDSDKTADTRPVSGTDWDGFAKALGFRNVETETNAQKK